MIWLRLLSVLIIILLVHPPMCALQASENTWEAGPSKKPPQLGRKVTIFVKDYEMKIDEDGDAYTEMSIQELTGKPAPQNICDSTLIQKFFICNIL